MHSSMPPGRLILGTAGTKAGGKLIDEWTFDSGFARSERFTVEVFMRKRLAGFEKSGGVDFVAQCPALPEGSMASTDIEDLRLRVEGALREQSILKSGVTWENWLEVVVRGGSRSYGSRPLAAEELIIEYRTLQRGRHPELAGSDFTMNTNHVAVAFPKPKKAGHTSEGVKVDIENGIRGMASDGRDEEAEYSYIVDSPENRAALDGMISSLRTLRVRLSSFLGQDGIADALVEMQAKSQFLALRA